MRIVSLRKPTVEYLGKFLAAQRSLPYTYTGVGATADTPPEGYVVDRTRVKLGEGEAVFNAAKTALRRWEQFRLGWVEAWPPTTPIEVNAAVAVMGRAQGLWWLNACRIIYLVDEVAPVSKFGFAYGTLPGHVESGEERFTVEWEQATNNVWYDILAFSKPNHFLTRFGYILVRRAQKRFGRDSAAAMIQAASASQG